MSPWRPTAALLIYLYSFEESFQTLDWPSVLHWDFGRTTARLSFYFPCIAISLSECALLICSYASCLHLLYLMSKLSCEYFHSTHPRTACSYHLCMRATQTFVADVVIIIISKHDCPLLYYPRVLNVCEYIQTYSLTCPWLLSWPDFRAWR